MSETVEREEDLEWREAREIMQEVDTDYVKDQLGVMTAAELVYSDGQTSEWCNDMEEKYETLVEAFGGEESVNQYLDIAPRGVSVAVEHDDEPVFAVYAQETGYESIEGPKIDFDAAI